MNSPVTQRMPVAKRWWFAIKPGSWPKLLVPGLLGVGLAAPWGEGVSGLGLALGLAFVCFDLLYIVLLNDYGDRRVDALKRQMFPDGSPKTIPDGILPARSLLLAGVVFGCLALLCATLASWLLPRPWSLPAGGLALAIFAAYSLPPLALNYRGGGELLEVAGVGVVLPALCAYFAVGRLPPELLVWLIGFLPLCFTSALASGLGDEQSDRAGGKRTFTTAFGNQAVRVAAEANLLLGAGVWLVTGIVMGRLWSGGAACVVVVLFCALARRRSSAATTNRFAQQRLYKAALHGAIWWGAISLVVSTWLETLP